MTDTNAALEWRFSDGTVVRLGGVIEGDGPMARALRGDLERMAAGRPVVVNVAPHPGGDDPLDVGDPYHVHQWLGQTLRGLTGVQLTAAPVVAVPQFPNDRPIEPYGHY
jgi:hypothetical protein